MPFVRIEVIEGRTRAEKRVLVDRLEALGTPRRDVTIVLHEPPMENWGVHGGRLASEVELGYRLNV